MIRSSAHKILRDEAYFCVQDMNIATGHSDDTDDVTAGNGPYACSDGKVCAVFSGDLYNVQEIRFDLEKKGRIFQTLSELVVCLYEEYGTDFATKLNGAFVIALWDGKRKKLLLVRDRIGERTVYYFLKDGRIFFGSDMKILLECPFYEKEIDFESLHHYFSLRSVPQPRSIFKGIRYVLPGEILTFQKGIVQTMRYWDCVFGEGPTVTERVAVRKISTLLTESVKERMGDGAQFGALLSGGLDSSSVVATLSKLSARPLKTFHLNYGKAVDGKLADVAAARKIAELYKTEHHEYVMGSGEIMRNIKESIEIFDEPFGVFAPFSFFSDIEKHGQKIIFTGIGGEELFGGYAYHHLVASDSSVNVLLRQYIFSLCDFNESQKRELYSDFLKEKTKGFDSMTVWKGYFKQASAKRYLDKIFEIDIRNFLSEQTMYSIGKGADRYSLRLVNPLLDYRLVEYVASLKGEFKVRNDRKKHLLKEVVKDLLPEELINRPKEVFALSADQCLLDGMEGHVRKILSRKRIGRHGFFEGDVVVGFVDEYYSGAAKKKPNGLSGKSYLADKLFILIIFQLWWEKQFG